MTKRGYPTMHPPPERGKQDVYVKHIAVGGAVIGSKSGLNWLEAHKDWPTPTAEMQNYQSSVTSQSVNVVKSCDMRSDVTSI